MKIGSQNSPVDCDFVLFSFFGTICFWVTNHPLAFVESQNICLHGLAKHNASSQHTEQM